MTVDFEAIDFVRTKNKAKKYEKEKKQMENLQLKKETINMPTEIQHYGWFCDDKDFGNKYKPYRDWIEQKNHILWEEYYSGMLDNDTSIMQKFCDVYNINVDCHYDDETDGIYLIKK